MWDLFKQEHFNLVGKGLVLDQQRDFLQHNINLLRPCRCYQSQNYPDMTTNRPVQNAISTCWIVY